MGDEILKIKYILILLLATLALKADSSMEENLQAYDNLFDSINTKRFGLEKSSFQKLKDPFLFKPSQASSGEGKASDAAPKKISYILYAVIENRAKINKTWLKVGENIDGYRVAKITQNSATLVGQQNSLNLKLSNKGYENVIISTK